MIRTFLGLALLFLMVLGSSDCGKNSSSSSRPVVRAAGADIGSDEVTDYNLEPVIPQDQLQPRGPVANSFNISPKNLSRNTKTGQISLFADIDDQKDISLVGSFDNSTHEAHLFSADKNTEAVAVCADDDFCDSMVVTVYKKGKEGHKQFFTPFHGTADTTSDVVEDDEGLGAGEYVAPPSSFDFTPSQVEPQKELTQLSQAVGPHSCSKDRKTKKCIAFGRLVNGVKFPSEGPGFSLQNKDRQEIWSTELLVSLMTSTLYDMNKIYGDRPPLEISEVSKKEGGFFPPHVSHENGLDVDVSYPVKTAVKSSSWRPMTSGKKINENFDVERFWFIAKTLVQKGDVPFIFVDPEIKKVVCSYAKSKHEYSDDPTTPAFKALLALWPARGEYNHESHFHVREQCAPWPLMRSCQKVATPPITQGTGCAT